MRAAAFDLEIARDIPAGGRWQDAAPLGVTCAALSLVDRPEPMVWQGVPQLAADACRKLVRSLQRFVEEGYTLVTWNGCGFDFAMLAIESNLHRECARLALHHVDLMLLVTFTRGWYLALQKALQGAGLDGKLESVTLSDGTRLTGMNGSLAPQLWAQGESDAVLAYLRNDPQPARVPSGTGRSGTANAGWRPSS